MVGGNTQWRIKEIILKGGFNIEDDNDIEMPVWQGWGERVVGCAERGGFL